MKSVTIASIYSLIASFLISSAVMVQKAYAESAASLDLNCAKTVDPYERPHRISQKSKRYSSQCMDTQRFRFSEVIKQDQDELVFTNYMHEDQYWTATLSLDAVVDQVFFHVVRFEAISGVTAAHTQLRLKFSNATPLKLVSQSDPQIQSKALDLVISFEAGRPENIPYNFAMGAVDNYVAVARILSGAQRLSESTENITEQYELDILQEDKILIAVMGIQKSSLDGFSRFYNTISENCTTDAFNLLDAIPSRVGKSQAFLTVISNDPIAGPSVKALKERGILKARYADLDEELEKGISSYKPEGQPVEKPGLLPKVEGHPYSLVVASADPKTLSTQQNAAVEEIKAMTHDIVPRALHLVGSSLMLAEGDARDSMMIFLNEAASSLRQRLRDLNSIMPDQGVEVITYLIPWSEKNGTKVNLNDVTSVKARLPFDFYEIQNQDLGLVSNGVSQAVNAQNIPDLGLQAYGMAMQFYLKKNDWSVTMQILGGLKDRQQSLEVANTQVNIDTFVIPRPLEVYKQPTILLNLNLIAQDSVPSFFIEFGAFGGLKAKMEPKSFGQFTVLKNTGCGDRLDSTPKLSGAFAESATGYSVVDYLFHGKSVSFNIFKVKMDVLSQRIVDMDVRFNFSILGIPIRCLSRDDVNTSFLENANEQIEKLAESLKTTDAKKLMTPVLDKILTNQGTKAEEDLGPR